MIAYETGLFSKMRESGGNSHLAAAFAETGFSFQAVYLASSRAEAAGREYFFE